eukprot:305973_1
MADDDGSFYNQDDEEYEDDEEYKDEEYKYEDDEEYEYDPTQQCDIYLQTEKRGKYVCCNYDWNQLEALDCFTVYTSIPYYHNKYGDMVALKSKSS